MSFEAMTYGPIGSAVDAAVPHSEADPIGIYAATLALYSAALAGHVEMDTGRPVTVWTVLAGRSAIGRKGYALRTARQLLDPSIGAFLGARVVSGISSGPSLVNHLWELELETAGSESGVDGRALVIEEEWASVLKRSRRCPTFSQQLRAAWDGGSISNTTKVKNNGSQIVQRPLLGFHAHITPGEWATYVTASEALGGTFNRVLPVLVEGSKMLPYNHRPTISETRALTEAYQWATSRKRVIGFTAQAGQRFDELRAEIEDRMIAMPEHLSCYMERSAEQVARVAAVLTAAEQKTRIGKTAVEAAWTFVQYSMASVEKLVTEAATGGSSRVVKSLPDLIRETLHRHAGQATSTIMLRALGTRVTAGSLKETVDRMDDVEVFKDTTATGRGAKPTVYRLVRPDQQPPGEHHTHPETSNAATTVTAGQKEPPSLRVVPTSPTTTTFDLRLPAEG
ncbi:DUF3987 domain-containing protein [Streptomyces sp. 4N509B]|uniref:DUF3987 domain-containing protein n=1 Tax=Streptomyces sp. 4N509B TaxID=3457413 RepID=UPI003FD11E41